MKVLFKMQDETHSCLHFYKQKINFFETQIKITLRNMIDMEIERIQKAEYCVDLVEFFADFLKENEVASYKNMERLFVPKKIKIAKIKQIS